MQVISPGSNEAIHCAGKGFHCFISYLFLLNSLMFFQFLTRGLNRNLNPENIVQHISLVVG